MIESNTISLPVWGVIRKCLKLKVMNLALGLSSQSNIQNILATVRHSDEFLTQAPSIAAKDLPCFEKSSVLKK